MNVSVFGTAFLVVALFLMLFQRLRLFGLLFAAAALQGPSVLDVTLNGVRHGVTPFAAIAGLIALDVLRKLHGTKDLESTLKASRPAALWSAFALFTWVSVFCGPVLFSGSQVLLPLSKEGVQSAGVALGWTVNHVAQLVNVSLIVGGGGLVAVAPGCEATSV